MSALARPQQAPVCQLGQSNVARHEVQTLWRAGGAWRQQRQPQRQQQHQQQQRRQQHRPSALPADDSIEASGEFCMPAFVTAGAHKPLRLQCATGPPACSALSSPPPPPNRLCPLSSLPSLLTPPVPPCRCPLPA